MMNPEDSKLSKRHVTLEALLHLKRAERPPAEFWTLFEQELRAKQLAAIMVKRSWWRTAPAGLAGLRRYQLPLGATAILAITFLSVREDWSPSPAVPSPVAARVELAASPARKTTPIAQEVAALVSAPSASIAQSESSYVPVVAADEMGSLPAPQTLRVAAAESGSLSDRGPWMASTQQRDSRNLSPAAQSIAANLAAAEEAHPELTRSFYGSSGGFEKRGLPAPRRPAVDPLAQMRSPSDTHRERLLASALPSVSQVSGPSGERIAGRIADERLTEQEISRFGARGDRFLVKF